MENKQEILNKLLETLRLTRACDSLIDLYYYKKKGEEYVTAEFRSGCTNEICVTMDSGLGMIFDVLQGIKP